MMNFYYAIF